MPIVQISLIEGRDPALVSACVKAVARSIHECLGAPLNSIRVIATIVPAAYWAIGDQTKDQLGNGLHGASLEEMEARNDAAVSG